MKTMKFWGVLLALVVGTLVANAQSKIYNRYGVSLTYPSYLGIVDEVYEDGNLTLELTDDDEKVGLMIQIVADDELVGLIQMMGVDAMFELVQGEILKEFINEDITLGTVTRSGSTIILPFTYEEDGLIAKCEISYSLVNQKIVLTVLMGVGEKSYSDMKQAIKTLKVS